MKSIPVFAFLILLVEMCRGLEPCSQVTSCASCDTIRICRQTVDGEWVELFRGECDTHKCDPILNKCTSDSSATCPTLPEGLPCMQNGKYPADGTSAGYLICENNVISEAVDCVSGYYSTKHENCSATVPKNYYPSAGYAEWKPFEDARIYGFYDRMGSLRVLAKCDIGYIFSFDSQACVSDDVASSKYNTLQ